MLLLSENRVPFSGENGTTLLELSSGLTRTDAANMFESIEGSAKVDYIGQFFFKR
jgi:hypothetical protein